jgi:hypothetical protein
LSVLVPIHIISSRSKGKLEEEEIEIERLPDFTSQLLIDITQLEAKTLEGPLNKVGENKQLLPKTITY